LISRTHYELPLAGPDAVKFDALGRVVDWILLARARPSRGETQRIVLLGPPSLHRLVGPLFHLRLPLATARVIARRHPDIIVAQDPYIGIAALLARRLTRARLPVVVEVHGDWRTATRLYGTRARRLLAPLADRLAMIALLRADAVRAASPYTADLVRAAGARVSAIFPAHLDLDPFTASPPTPLPATPQALFVGVLERYKNVDGLLTAWQQVTERLPEARLRIVGRGTLSRLVNHTCQRIPTIEHVPWLPHEEIASALDEATCLVLPSRSEGMGRTIIEALARGRPVIASNVGGIPDLVVDGENGLLVDPNDPKTLAKVLVGLLSNHALAARLATNAYARFNALQLEPDQFAQSFGTLIGQTLSGATRSPTHRT
jgi:glycosyltransferase involved in cell wall biosynthesis